MGNIDAFKIILVVLGLLVVGSVFKLPAQVPAPVPINNPANINQKALDYALQQLGKPYVWGGRGPNGFDCSGLIVSSYRKAYPKIKFQNGTTIGQDATADILYNYNIIPLAKNEIRPGDIVFITSNASRITHVGMFIRWVNSNEFEFISVSSSKQKVAKDVWPVKGKIGKEWFVGAGRLKGLP